MKRKTWTKKEWKEKREKILSKNPNCSLCGSNEKLIIHHPQKWKDQTQEEYESLDGTNVLCSRCHFALHHGMDLCPECKTHYKKEIYSVCGTCCFKEYDEAPEEKRELMREANPGLYMGKELHEIEQEDIKTDEWFEKFYNASKEEKEIMLEKEDKRRTCP